MGKPDDPRDPPVAEDGYVHSGPELTAPSPILLALRGSLPAETCAVCGFATALHYDTSGLHWIGCTGVPARKRLGTMVSRPLQQIETWGDQHPGVSLALLDALRVGCGAEVAQFIDTLSASECLNLSRRLAEIAVTAHLAEDARWNR